MQLLCDHCHDNTSLLVGFFQFQYQSYEWMNIYFIYVFIWGHYSIWDWLVGYLGLMSGYHLWVLQTNGHSWRPVICMFSSRFSFYDILDVVESWLVVCRQGLYLFVNWLPVYLYSVIWPEGLWGWLLHILFKKYYYLHMYRYILTFMLHMYITFHNLSWPYTPFHNIFFFFE